ncbi:RNA polymerase sigma factor [Beijerinckia sp. L45]|uniref:RNA polymerase sigma factor n=1 Tax=Beijerinckia sp. L45 TaxID=1641855 RepID=UPI00131AA300|nr:sigma-70 family RNA polymerase sigma factor [Beijerinckia sp. L45]
MDRSDSDAHLEGYIPALRRYAFALVGDHHRADDLVQDCLLRAIASRTAPEGDRRAWLFTILRNSHLTTERDARRRGVPMRMDEVSLPTTPADQAARLEARDALAVIAQLPEDQKSLLLLIGVDDLSYDEAARVLGIPIGTVMSRLSRARRHLRDLMETGRPFALRSVK